MSLKPSYEQLEARLNELKKENKTRQANREKLEAKRDFYQAAFDQAGIAMTLMDLRTGEVVARNKKVYEELGYTEEEYQAKKRSDMVADEDVEFTRAMNRLIDEGRYAYTSKMKKKDGTILSVYRIAVVLNLDGKKHMHNSRVDFSKQVQLENQIRKGEEAYHQLLENMGEGYYEVDLAGNLTFTNQSFCKISGYPLNELIGKNNRDYMSPKTADKVYAFFNELYRSGETSMPFLEYELIKKDGTIASAEISVSLIRDLSGEITGFRGLVRDKTERMNIEKELRESEELYRTMFNHSGVAMNLTDARTGFRAAYNKKAYEELGYTDAEYKNIRSQDLAVSDNEVDNLIKATLKQGYFNHYLRLRRKDGEVRTFQRSAVKVKINGKTYFHNIRMDMTEMIRTEQALKESEARFRTVFEAAADAILLISIDTGKILDANQAACDQIGYTREEFMKMYLIELTGDKYVESAQSLVNNLKKEQQFFENVYYNKEGKRLYAEISSSLLEIGAQQVVMAIVRDITARKQKEKELKAYQQNLETMVKERTHELELAQKEMVKKERLAVLGQLTVTVSHDLRDPLNVIEYCIDRLKKNINADDGKIQKHLNRIDEQTGICDTIVGDLMEYTRGKKAALVKDDILSWFFQLMAQWEESQTMMVQLEIPEKLPAIYHDRVKMKQVLINIFENAFQAVEDKAIRCQENGDPFKPEVRLRIAQESDNILFSLSDNGIGMTPEVLDRVFDPLFTTRARGTGLGMANVHKIVSEHGGRISISSQFGQGTDVVFTLPKRMNDTL